MHSIAISTRSSHLPISAESPVRNESSLSAEALLAAAILHQAVIDTRSPSPWIRRSALDFLRDAEALRFWCELLNLPELAVQRHVAAVLAAGSLDHCSPQLTLW